MLLGSTPQISLAYSEMVRSLENFPDDAMFIAHFLSHSGGFCTRNTQKNLHNINNLCNCHYIFITFRGETRVGQTLPLSRKKNNIFSHLFHYFGWRPPLKVWICLCLKGKGECQPRNCEKYCTLLLSNYDCDVYIKVYISGMEMSQRIRVWYQILPKMLISWENGKKSLFWFKKNCDKLKQASSRTTSLASFRHHILLQSLHY